MKTFIVQILFELQPNNILTEAIPIRHNYYDTGGFRSIQCSEEICTCKYDHKVLRDTAQEIADYSNTELLLASIQIVYSTMETCNNKDVCSGTINEKYFFYERYNSVSTFCSK
jgi:hypothetical protein